jgi:hypothetical protein
MDEAVAAKQQVGLRKHVLAEIKRAKLPLRPAVADPRGLDQSRNDVGSDVVGDRKFYLGHPVKIAAGQIKQRADIEVANQFGKGFAQFPGVVQGGPATRDRLLITPDVALKDFGENLSRPAMEIADHLRAQPGQDRGGKRSARNVDASRKERGPAQLIGKSGERRHAKNSIKSRKRRTTQKADKFSRLMSARPERNGIRCCGGCVRVGPLFCFRKTREVGRSQPDIRVHTNGSFAFF